MTTCYQANLLDQDTEYNGWTNYETWNAALWIGADQGLYEIARTAMDYDHLKTSGNLPFTVVFDASTG